VLNYVSIDVTDLERSGSFYDSLLGPLGWRRQTESDNAIAWGMIRPVFFVVEGNSNRPGFGVVSFPTKSIPAVKAAWEAGLEAGGENDAQPGSAAAQGAGTYAARLLDPDGYSIEICVAND
jgi:catechol 2,3-dioxygenase-like lactoylglutathione lyase family enzyme